MNREQETFLAPFLAVFWALGIAPSENGRLDEFVNESSALKRKQRLAIAKRSLEARPIVEALQERGVPVRISFIALAEAFTSGKVDSSTEKGQALVASAAQFYETMSEPNLMQWMQQVQSFLKDILKTEPSRGTKGEG